MNVNQAIAKMTAIKKQRMAEFENEKLQLMAQNKEYFDAVTSLAELEFNSARDNSINPKKRNALIKQIQTIESKNGIIKPQATCKKCNDEYFINGKVCDCVIKNTISSSNLQIKARSFNESDFSLFDDGGRTQTLYRNVQSVINKFPDTSVKNIIVMGSTGTGKTFLASCAIGEAINAGLSVASYTAFNLNQAFLAYHTTFNDAKQEHLYPILDASLLVIDDLGTESILKNVTCEYLYVTLNERTLSGKLTLITTNLTPDQILSRYGERIYSRIFNKALCYAQVLTGKDLRKIL